jgi:hypothetical protein
LKCPLDSRKNSRFSGKDGESSEVDDLGVCFHLGEVRVDGQVGGHRGKDSGLHVKARLD